MANVQAQAGQAPARDPARIEFSFEIPSVGSLVAAGQKIPAIAWLMAIGLMLRLLLAFLPGFGVDIGTFSAWSGQLAHDGPWNFCQTDFFTDYAPGYMYVLTLIGKLNQW